MVWLFEAAVFAGVSTPPWVEPEVFVPLIAPPVLTATPDGADVVVDPLVVDVVLEADSDDVLDELPFVADADEAAGSELEADDGDDAVDAVAEEPALDAEELLDDELLDESDEPASAHAVP